MKRAIGIVRVSESGGRSGDSFASPGEQRDRIITACKRDNLDLLDVVEEIDVSGGTPLSERTGLRGALEAVEAGDADVLVVAYFDRLVRSMRVQTELVERVEAAGGDLLAVDVGNVTNGSAAQKMTSHFLGAVAQYHRDSTRERTGEAQARAVARGVAPWPNVTPGYRRGADGRYVPDGEAAAVVSHAFEMRADGAIVADVRTYLGEHGVELGYHGTCALLASRVVLGELHFGKLANLEAHPPIVNRETWQRVQRVRVPRGRRAKSERLLARLGVLHCASCGSSMVVGAQNRWPFYRCNRVREDCPARVTISAPMVEAVVTDAVRARLADEEGRASTESGALDAAEALELAQHELDALISILDPLEPASRARLAAATAGRDAARERVEQLGGVRASLTVTASADWDRLSVDGRRALIRATVDRVTITPGRGTGRIAVKFVGE